MKVLIPQDITQPGKDYLTAHSYEVLVTNRSDLASICQDVADCDAILARTCPYPAEVFQSAPKLKCIARHGSGYDNVDVAAATQNGTYVTITPTAPVNAVAETTMLLLLACARKLKIQNTQLCNGNWAWRGSYRGVELKDKTLGVIGFGLIGQAVAKKAHYGFDMKVLGYSRHTPKGEDWKDYAAHTSDIEEVFEKADLITVHLPSTPATRGMFNAENFAKLKQGVIFVNTARGDLVEEAALYDALTTGQVAAAGLDVYAQEPCPGDNPLLKLENVIATPHTASLTHDSMDQMGLLAAMEIHRVLSGNAPQWAVNQVTAE